MSTGTAIVTPTLVGLPSPRAFPHNPQSRLLSVTSRSLRPLVGTDTRIYLSNQPHHIFLKNSFPQRTRFCKAMEDPDIDNGGGAELSRNSELDTIITSLQDSTSTEEPSPGNSSNVETEQRLEDSSWRQLHGCNNWAGLLDPLDENLRRELVRCGNLVQAAYHAFFSNLHAPQDDPKIILPDNSYHVMKLLYATPSVKWMASVAPWITQRSSLIGYVAICMCKLEINRMGRRDIVIVLRGTTTFLEWAENVRICLVRVTGCSKVATGFLSLYRTSSPPNSSSLSAMVLEELRRLTEKFKGEELSITVTGHSLGGVLALLIADELSAHLDHVPSIAVFSFASPKVGNKAFADRLDKKGVKVLRVVNSNDIIPRVPWFLTKELCRTIWHNIGDYVHLGTELRVGSRLSIYCHTLDSYLDLVKGFQSGVRSSLERLNLKNKNKLREMGLDWLVPMQALVSSEPAKELSLMERFVRKKFLLKLGLSLIKLHNTFSNFIW